MMAPAHTSGLGRAPVVSFGAVWLLLLRTAVYLKTG